MKIVKLHKRIMKFIKILELHVRNIKSWNLKFHNKLMKIIEMPIENNENHENYRNENENHENHENHRIPYENYENQ